MIIPTYTKREFIKTPQVTSSVPSPVRLAAAYENGLTRTGRLLPAALETVSKMGELFQPDGGSVNLSADDSLRLRQTLVNAVQKDISGNGAVKTDSLDAAAAKSFTSENTSGPAARDYTVLRRAAREAQAASASGQKQAAAETEETLVRQVGSLVRSPAALEEYLSGQLGTYEERLRQNGLNEPAVRAGVRAVRERTVAENIGRSLSCGDWRAAEATLAKHGESLAEPLRQTCAAKTRDLFARSQAEKLWAEGAAETDGSVSQIRRYAQERLKEPDAELNASVRQTLDALARRETAQKHTAAAQTLDAMSRLSSSAALNALDGSVSLDLNELAPARRAALFFDGDATRSDAVSFVACYFGGEQKEHERLFKRNKISARDYVRLEAARHRRAGGQSQRAQELLCRGIDVWMQKKGFSKSDVSCAQYAVLSSGAETGALPDVWKQIKNLLDV